MNTAIIEDLTAYVHGLAENLQSILYLDDVVTDDDAKEQGYPFGLDSYTFDKAVIYRFEDLESTLDTYGLANAIKWGLLPDSMEGLCIGRARRILAAAKQSEVERIARGEEAP